MDIDANLPLTEATFLILLSLSPTPQHGYGILKDVEQLSGGRIVLSTGTLYGAIKRLLEQGWIARDGDAPETETTRTRKRYRLTDLGQRILSAEAARLDRLARTARLRFEGGGA